MTTTPKRLFTGRVASTVTTLASLASDSTVKQIITAASVDNTDTSSDHTLTLWAPTGGSAGAQNVLLTALNIPAKTAANGGFKSLEPYLRGKTLAAGYTIVGQADADGVLTVTIDGMEFSA